MATLKTDMKTKIEDILAASKKKLLEFGKDVTIFDHGFGVRAKRDGKEEEQAEIVSHFYCFAERYLKHEFSHSYKQFYLSIQEEQRTKLDALPPLQSVRIEEERIFMEECFKTIRDAMEQEIAADRAFLKCHKLLPVFLCNRGREILTVSSLHFKETPKPSSSEIGEYWLNNTSKSLIEILTSFTWGEGCYFYKAMIKDVVLYCVPLDMKLSISQSLLFSKTMSRNIKNTELMLNRKQFVKSDLSTSVTVAEESNPADDKEILASEHDSAADIPDTELEDFADWDAVRTNPNKSKLW